MALLDNIMVMTCGYVALHQTWTLFCYSFSFFSFNCSTLFILFLWNVVWRSILEMLAVNLKFFIVLKSVLVWYNFPVTVGSQRILICSWENWKSKQIIAFHFKFICRNYIKFFHSIMSVLIFEINSSITSTWTKH